MEYLEFNPCPKVARFVKCYWTLTESEAGVYRPEPILPDGCPELVFNLDAPFKRLCQGELTDQPRSIVVGQMKHAVTILPTRRVKLFGVRFRPFGLFPLLRESVDQLTERIEPIAAVFGARGERIEFRINEARDTNERIAILEEEFGRELAADRAISAEVENGIERIVAAPTSFRVRTFADELGTNLKQLERSFRREVGLTPKYLARITRLQSLLGDVAQVKQSNWTDITYAHGFYDQSHLIKEFRSFTGVAPHAFTKRDHQFADFFGG